jgi:signal transduction histidine kinase
MRRAFLHIALHDLKAPIGAVSTLLDNLSAGLCGPLNDKQGEWIGRARKRTDGLLSFLRDFQVMSELESGRQFSEQAQDVNLTALLNSVVEEYRDLARQKDQILLGEIPGALLVIRGIEPLLREAVANYITNALKYSPAGSEVVVRAERLDDGVRIEVRDRGPGIAPQDQPKLFREFVRLHVQDPNAPRVGGTGLGLSIVQRIAELHGGRVGLTSEPGRGSTFFMELPVLAIAECGV